MSFLSAKTFDFGDRESGDTTFCKRLTYFFEFEWFDDGGDLFQGQNSLVCMLKVLGAKFVGNRITPIFAKTSMGDANANRRLPTFVLIDS